MVRLLCIIFSLPSESLGPIELSSLMFLPSLSQHLGFPRLIDSFIRFDDPRILVRQDRTPSSRPYNHFPTLFPSLQLVCFLLILAGLLRHFVHIQKTPRVSFPPHTSHLDPFFPAVFIHSDPNPKIAVSSRR